MKHVLSLAMVAMIALALGACQPSAEEAATTADQAELTLCMALEQFGVALQKAEGMDSMNTIEEVTEANEGVQTAWAAVLTAAGETRDARMDALDAAYQGLDAAIDAVPSDQTVAGAAASLMPQMGMVRAAYDEFYTLQCPEGGATK